MEIAKIDDIISSTSRKKTNTTNSVFGFNAQLEAVRNSFLQSNSSDKLSEEVKSALATIEKVLDMNITGKDYKGNGKLDIISIMKKHGNKLSSSDTKDFTKSLDTLLDNDMIDYKDFVEVIKMLTLQNKYRNISDKLESDTIDTITNTKNTSENKCGDSKNII